MSLDMSTLIQMLRQQQSSGRNPEDAVSAVLENLQAQTHLQRSWLPLSLEDLRTFSQALSSAFSGLSLVEYARLLQPVSASAEELALVLNHEFTPRPAELAGALLDDRVYPETGRAEMKEILKACRYDDASIEQALRLNYPIDMEVQADQPWQKTGLILKQEEKAIIDYISGTWFISHSVPDCDANDEPRYIARSGYAMPGKPEGGLIGIMNNTPFWVGKHAETPAGSDGQLCLCANDDLEGQYGAGLRDNHGSLKVRIRVTLR